MSYLVIGIMSGTSLDGIDIAMCRFRLSDEKWSYDIIAAKTVEYSSRWREKLLLAPSLGAEEFLLLHNEYGRYIGEQINEFLTGKEVPDIIASHGHTIFHQPEKKFTFQIGNGASIAAATGITTISDFRSLDIALGGQGAPLVPLGDKLLFSEFDYCLNIGGFANISFEQNSNRIAFDICPANIILNGLAMQLGEPFDLNGHLGASGKISQSLLNQLNSVVYYRQKPPKSLGREWLDKEILPLLAASSLSVEDQAATFYEHIAEQIATVVASSGKLLITGGGANNLFLINRLKEKTLCEVILPPKNVIDFKEALIFAFLGLLTFTGKNNVFASSTGSIRDHCGGAIYPIGLKMG
jgi:anhydro-N-acetylmuramic acid kinase